MLVAHRRLARLTTMRLLGGFSAAQGSTDGLDFLLQIVSLSAAFRRFPVLINARAGQLGIDGRHHDGSARVNSDSLKHALHLQECIPGPRTLVLPMEPRIMGPQKCQPYMYYRSQAMNLLNSLLHHLIGVGPKI